MAHNEEYNLKEVNPGLESDTDVGLRYIVEMLQSKVEDVIKTKDGEIFNLRKELLDVKELNFKMQQHLTKELEKLDTSVGIRLGNALGNLQRENLELKKEITDLAKKTDQTLDIQNKVSGLIDWKKTKTGEDEKIHHGIIEQVDNVRRRNNDTQEEVQKLMTWKAKKIDADRKEHRICHEDIDRLSLRVNAADVKISDIQAWRKEKTTSDKTLQESIDKHVATTVEKFDDIEKKMDKVTIWQEEKTAQDIEKQGICEKRMETLGTRTDEHAGLIGEINKRLARTKPNMFDARVTPSQELVVDKLVKLDVCDDLGFDDDGWFDRQSCCLVPQRDCRLVLGWRMCQGGEGRLMLYFKGDAFTGLDYLGMTTYRNDVIQGVKLWEFKKGQRMWMEVKRTKGEAKIHWCHFMAWVVG